MTHGYNILRIPAMLISTSFSEALHDSIIRTELPETAVYQRERCLFYRI